MAELTGSGYFYNLATLSMAFAGFSVIVVALRQVAGKPFSPLQIEFTRLFVEAGLASALFAMLPPTLAICGLRQPFLWQVASAIVLVIMVPWLVTWIRRRNAAQPNGHWSTVSVIIAALNWLTLVAVLLNLIGIPITSGPAPIAVLIVVLLSTTSVHFVSTFSSFIQG
ncbi:MAG TPA: hypothetical protein VFE17_12555 [Candidatus Baltobacteraceae bacterium]|jgi:hypothetical protein|nr:hypothetical protein [Candidatus Baltobacteraceae bacterium]